MSYQQPPIYNQQQPPSMPQSKRKVKNLGWIIALIIVFFVGYGIGHSGTDTTTSTSANTSNTTSTSTSTSTQPNQAHTTPTPATTWKTTHTYTGTGAKKTESFTIGDDWKIQWSCQGDVANNIDAPIYITVYDSGNNMVDSPSTTCKASNTPTTGETEEHQGGTFYLDINTGIDWTITIQELK